MITAEQLAELEAKEKAAYADLEAIEAKMERDKKERDRLLNVWWRINNALKEEQRKAAFDAEVQKRLAERAQ